MRVALLTMLLAGLVSQAPARAQASDVTTYKLTGSRIAFGQDIKVQRDEEVSNALVVIGGSATVDGRVRDGIVVVGGDLTLGPTADVQGEIVLVGGQLNRDPNARQSGSINYVSIGDWSRRAAWWPQVNFGGMGRWLSLAGTLARLAVLGVLMMLVLLVARAPVARVGRAAAAEPIRAILIGLAAEIFFVPFLVAASIAMAITIVGLPFVAILIPVSLAVAVFALVLGYTALACRIGEWFEDILGWHPGSAVLATAVGFFLIVGPTLAARVIGIAPEPLRIGAFALLMFGLAIEYFVWTIGLGAAIMTGLGRWHVAPPPIVQQA
ncbi:MAG: hypothetical protein ABI665_26070 [Vicinamibacterales bacterium]